MYVAMKMSISTVKVFGGRFFFTNHSFTISKNSMRLISNLLLFHLKIN